MNLIEPTYLRYVHDNLEKGSLNAENAAALPYGFIGLYEEAFQSNIPISKRQLTLKRLAIWALFKGGVSSYLASQILVESQEETKSLIDNFSTWFNTTDSNKYILYHDRLRTYLIQKLSSHELQVLNEQIISYLEKALEAQKGDEAEIYALEHLSTHMATESQMDSNYQRLHDFANQEALWPRQVSVSKEYKWSQQAVQYSIKEGARRHHEMNTLNSTVNSVKLIQEEENNVRQIFDILKSGDYQTAIKRFKIFKGEKYLAIFFLLAKDILNDESTTLEYKKLACNELLSEENIKKLEISLNYILIPENYIYYHLIKFHFKFKKLGINDEKLLSQFNFNGDSFFKVLQLEKLSLTEIYYFCEKILGQSLIKIVLFVYKNYIQENDENLSPVFLELFNKAINIAFRLKQEHWDNDNDFMAFIGSDYLALINADVICEKLLLIIVNHSLYEWVKNSSSFTLETIENFKNGNYSNNVTNDQRLAWNPTRSISFLKILKKIGFQKKINFIIYNQDFDMDDLRKICPYLYLNHSVKSYNFLLEKVNEDFEKSIIYVKICQEIINTKDISKLKNYQHKKHLYKFLDEIKEKIFSLSDLENGKKINESNLFINIELHIKLFKIYFELDSLDESNYFIQEAKKLNGIIAERIFQPKDSKLFLIYRKKYKNLGLICEAYLEKNQKQEFKKIFSESLEKINNYNSKDKITQSLSGLNQILPSLIQLDENLASECILKVFKLLNQLQHHMTMINFGELSSYSFKKKITIILSKEFKNLNQNDKDYWIKSLEECVTFNTYYLNDALNKISLTLNEIKGPSIYLSILKKLTYIKEDLSKKKIMDKNEILNSFEITKIPVHFNYSFLDEKLINKKTISKTKKEESGLIKSIKEYGEKLKNGVSNLQQINKFINDRNQLLKEETGKIDLELINIFTKDTNVNLEKIEKYISTMIENYDDKTEAYYQSGNLLLKNINFKRNGYDNIKHFNTAIKFIKLSLKTLFTALDEKDISNFNWYGEPGNISRREFLIKIIEILIQNDGINAIHEVCFEFREIFKVKYDSNSWSARINKGKIIPEEFYFYFYEIISKKLIENGFVEEGHKIIELVLDKNQIAKTYIYTNLNQLEKLNKQNHLIPIPKIVELIEESEPLLDYWDSHSTELQWPNRGYTYLELSEYFIKTSDYKNAEKYIDKAFNELKEIDDKKLVIEKFNPNLQSYDQTFKTQYNDINYSYFMYNVITKLIKVENSEKSIELLKLINPDVDVYITGIGADKINMQGITFYPYSDSVYEIAWLIFRDDQKLALNFVLNNEKVIHSVKEKFIKEFIGKFNLVENIIEWYSEFKEDKIKYLNILSNKFNNISSKNDKFYYLCKYFNDKENFHKILTNESYKHFFIKKDEKKLRLLEEVIDFKEWREISANV